ncbi:MAG TPA: substrate-binding domain-containing protein [Anaerolineales bacterium]
MKHKLLLIVMLLTMLSIVAAACSPAVPATTNSSSNTTKQPPYVIGVSNVSVANSFRVQMIEEIKYYGKQHPDMIKDVIVTDAGGDANKQISDIEDLVTRKVDVLLVAPASDTALTPAVDQAVAAGIPVIVFNSGMQSDKVSARALPPYHEWAKLTADWLGKTMNGKGDVIALRGIAGLAAEADEWAGVEEALKNYPDIKIICTEYADWAYDKAKTAVANCLANHPDVNGVLAIGDAMTWAAAETLKDQGYDVTQIPMIGIGGSNGFLKYWQANNLNAYVIADPTDIGVTALKAALDLLQGKTIQPNLTPTQYDIYSSTLSKFVKTDLPDSAWVGTGLPDDVLKSLLNK